MSKRYWTADLHLGHANICAYCNRPWLKPGMIVKSEGMRGFDWVSEEAKNICAENMNRGLINNANMRVKEDDDVFHVGDFCCKGKERGVEGTKTKAREWLKTLNGRWVLFEGNHDENNGLRCDIRTAIVKVGPFLAFVQHKPIERKEEVPGFCDIVICGHVHEKWQTKWIDGLLNINVGVDANRFMPISDCELIEMADKELSNGYSK